MATHETVIDLMNDGERLKRERDALAKALSDLLDANERLNGLSYYHQGQDAAIAGQEVAEREARSVMNALLIAGKMT